MKGNSGSLRLSSAFLLDILLAEISDLELRAGGIVHGVPPTRYCSAISNSLETVSFEPVRFLCSF
jgi:hypothetical protein